MKRVRISLILVLLIFSFALYSGICTQRVSVQMLSYLASAQNEISAGDMSALTDTLLQMQAYYEGKERQLLLFMRRDTVLQPHEQLCMLQVYAAAGDTKQLYCELVQTRMQILQMRDFFFRLV